LFTFVATFWKSPWPGRTAHTAPQPPSPLSCPPAARRGRLRASEPVGRGIAIEALFGSQPVLLDKDAIGSIGVSEKTHLLGS
jgi:hypothetical protein